MIQFYTWSTPNGDKIAMMLEECQLDYTVHPIDISEGNQFDDAFLAVNPNNKIPAIVDEQGPNDKPMSLFETGAILWYLAEKTGRFLPTDPVARYATLQWLMWQKAGFGPMLGQAHHFLYYAKEDVPYAKTRYGNEAKRLYGVLNKQLSTNPFVAGNEYTIADMATFPWVHKYHERQGIDLADFPHVSRWHDLIKSREAVQKALNLSMQVQSRMFDSLK